MASSPYTSAEDFFRKLRDEHADVRRSPNSARHVANFAMTAYHLAEWTWLLAPHRFPSSCSSAHEDVAQQCQYFGVVRGLANGSKHCILNNAGEHVPTRDRGGAFSDGFSAGFDIGSLQVETDTGWVDFGDVAKEAMAYWSRVFDDVQ